MYLDLSVNWPKKLVAIGQVLLVAALTAGLKALCWNGDMCSDRKCMQGYLGPICGVICLLVSILLIGILIDEVWGWTNVKERMVKMLMELRTMILELITQETPVVEIEMNGLNNGQNVQLQDSQVKLILLSLQ